MHFPKNGRRTKFTKCVFPKIGRRTKFAKCVFLKIGWARFPKSVHGLPAREKLSVFVYTSFFRVGHHGKFRHTRRRKYCISPKCQNFSGWPIFLQNTFCMQVLFSGCMVDVDMHFCPTQKNLHKIPKCVHGTPGRRKFVGFCVDCILQGSAFREICEFTTMKMLCFSKMSGFFRMTHFSAKHGLYASAVFRVYERCRYTFFVRREKFAKNPEMHICDCRSGKNCRFLCKVHSSGERILWNSVTHDDKNVVFWQNVQIFSDDTFFLQNTFCTQVLFSGCTINVCPRFCVRHKKFAKNPEMRACDWRSDKSRRFLYELHSSGECILWNLVIHDDENVVFWQNVLIFPENA